MQSLYIQIGADGLPLRWSSAPFAGATETADPSIDPLGVYFHANSVHVLPPRPAEWARFDPVLGVWFDPRSPAQIASDTANHREAAYAQVLTAVGSARAALITTLPGQDMIYLAKEAEARVWLTATSPQLEDFPLIAAETGLTAQTADQLAALWIAMAHVWRSAAARLERIRMQARADLETATTPAAMEQIVAAAILEIYP